MKNIDQYDFKFTAKKLEFLNVNQSRKNLNEIYSIRLGQVNRNKGFINLKTRDSIQIKLIETDDSIYFLYMGIKYSIEKSKLQSNCLLKFSKLD